jgi:sugar/nucleoside kinase (ribokinase family)
MQPAPPTYLLIGTVTKDLLPDDRFTAGGTVTYAGITVKRLGWRPVIVTAAAPDFNPPPFLADADWRILPSPVTTTFRNIYTPQGRQQTIGPIARSIGLADIPPDCHQAEVVHLCPLAQDVAPEIAITCNQNLLVTTPQGWLRQWDDRGHVSLGDWQGATELLPRLNATVISIEDIEGNWAVAHRWAAQTQILIVTQDKDGCTVLHQGKSFPVPPRPSQVIDPTGAGDIFAAAFFIRYFETGDLRHSAYFANVTASISLERPGPEATPWRHEVEAYIAQHPLVSNQ